MLGVQLVLGVALAVAAPQDSQKPDLVLKDGFEEIDWTPLVSHLIDPSSKLSFEDVRSPAKSSYFQNNRGQSLNWGFLSDAVWVRLRLQDERSHKTPLVLELGYNQLDNVQFYSCLPTSTQDWDCLQSPEPLQKEQGGRAFNDRRERLRATSDEFTFPSLSPGGQAINRYTLWVRVQSGSSVQLSGTIRTPARQAVYHREHDLIQGLYFGGLLILFLFNLLVGMSLGWVKYYAYVSYMGAWILFQGFLGGYGFTYLSPWLPDLIGTRVVPLGMMMTGCFALIFALMLLDVRKVSLRLWQAVLVLLAFASAWIPLAIVSSYDVSVRITALVFAPLWFIAEFACGIVCLKTQRRTAALYLASWGALVLGSLVFLLKTLGVLPINFFTSYAQQMGAWLQALFMSLAMADVINQLRRQTSQQAESLKSVNEQLRHVDQLKDQFMANTSHELRTPLHGIMGITEALLEDDSLSRDSKHKLRMVVSSGRRLVSLVNDILDFSRIQKDELTIQTHTIDLKSCLELVVAMFQAGRKKKDMITLSTDIATLLPLAYADENRLQQILFNLLGNALKFTHEGSIVVGARPEGDAILIWVKDTGIGIPQAKQANVFDSFVQADGSTARVYGGTGLGLTISKKLVELHKGKIWLESEEGKGTCFYFTIPMSSEKQVTTLVSSSQMAPGVHADFVIQESPALLEATEDLADKSEALLIEQRKKSLHADGRRLRILAADDDPMNLEVIKAHLEHEAIDLSFARDGEEAIRKLERAGPFDLILCDVMMPKKTGYEVLEYARKQWNMAQLPIILLTAKGQLSDLVKGFDAGANDYLTKPFAKKELLSRMQAHLLVARAHEALGRLVPKDFLRLLGHQQITDVKLGDATAQRLTILFTDIRNFTQIAEQLSPEATFHYVNTCLAHVGPAIRNNQGFVDKYIGDAVMAIFPQSVDDALRTALAIQREIDHFEKWREDTLEMVLSLGIGIHFGNTMLGTVGESERFDVTVISDAVNVASRIEGLTKTLGLRCILSLEAWMQLRNPGEFSFRPIGAIHLPGKSGAIELVEFLDVWPTQQRILREKHRNLLADAIADFRNGQIEKADAKFRQILLQDPLDTLVIYYITSCESLLAKGKPEGFDGCLSSVKAA